MFLALSDTEGLAYDYRAPTKAAGFTFFCFNPLTGDKSMWESGCAPTLIAQGHGLLTWNMRGQAGSPFTDGAIDEAAIVADALRLLQEVKPPNPIFVGLSIGGLYAAKVHLRDGGFACRGLVLINTLREIGPRLSWINSALLRLAETGGLDLLRDVYSPLLMGEAWQAEHRDDYLKPGGYVPISKSDGAWHLLKAGEASEWNVDWSHIDVPVLNVTGLQDQIFRDDAVIAALLAKLRNVKAVEYAGAGHMVPAETPQRLAMDLLEFAEGLT